MSRISGLGKANLLAACVELSPINVDIATATTTVLQAAVAGERLVFLGCNLRARTNDATVKIQSGSTVLATYILDEGEVLNLKPLDGESLIGVEGENIQLVTSGSTPTIKGFAKVATGVSFS